MTGFTLHINNASDGVTTQWRNVDVLAVDYQMLNSLAFENVTAWVSSAMFVCSIARVLLLLIHDVTNA